MISRFLGINNSAITDPIGTVRVLPIPYDATSSYKPGSRFGPSAILDASTQLEFFNDDIGWDATQHLNVFVQDEIELNISSPERMLFKIERSASQLIAGEDFLLALGGEHSISLPLILAHQKKYKNLHVIQIDAHADMRDSWNGSQYSHACVMRRIADLGIKITQIGVRNISQEGSEFLSTNSANLVSTWDADTIRKDEKFSELLAYLKNRIHSPVYLTVDVDGLDPSIIPATGTPEPGGLSWYQTIEILKSICLNHTVVGADVVELSPTSTLFYADFAAAKLCYKIISFSYYQKWKSQRRTENRKKDNQ